MKSVVKDAAKEEIKYPVLMIHVHTKAIALVTEKSTGTIVNTGSSSEFELGEYSTTLSTEYSAWSVFNGDVVLSNN